MLNSPTACSTCGGHLAAGARVCPTCGSPVGPQQVSPAGSAPATDGGDDEVGERPIAGAPENPFATELNRRLARLAQWTEASEPLGVVLPRLPPWAEEAAARSPSPEPWAEVVRGVERLAQRRISEAFDQWEERTSTRIARLEAYSVDSRLERSQVEDAVHAVKIGDVAQALSSFQQVDRVVALKERHLDQARGELERLLAFLRDLEALGLVAPGEPSEVASELERDLRAGQLAPLKRRVRLLRARAVARLTEALPEEVAQIGDHFVSERPAAVGRNDPGPRDLAVAARAVLDGSPEEGVRRLRALRGARGWTEGPASGTTGPTSRRRTD